MAQHWRTQVQLPAPKFTPILNSNSGVFTPSPGLCEQQAYIHMVHIQIYMQVLEPASFAVVKIVTKATEKERGLHSLITVGQ